jgi:hypothetical protein
MDITWSSTLQPSVNSVSDAPVVTASGAYITWMMCTQ